MHLGVYLSEGQKLTCPDAYRDVSYCAYVPADRQGFNKINLSNAQKITSSFMAASFGAALPRNNRGRLLKSLADAMASPTFFASFSTKIDYPKSGIYLLRITKVIKNAQILACCTIKPSNPQLYRNNVTSPSYNISTPSMNRTIA